MVYGCCCYYPFYVRDTVIAAVAIAPIALGIGSGDTNPVEGGPPRDPGLRPLRVHYGCRPIFSEARPSIAPARQMEYSPIYSKAVPP
jgi:hypothetical protein